MALETYRPWCRIDLRVRFEDFAEARVANRTLEPGNFVRFETQPDTFPTQQDQAGAGQNAGGATDIGAQQNVQDDLVLIQGILPLEVTVEENSFRVANTASVRFPWKDSNFFSLFIRTALLDVYFGSATADEFASADVLQNGLLSYMNVTGARARSHLRFRGYVDHWTDTHGDGGDWIELQARDYTALIMTAVVAPGSKIPLIGSASVPGVTGPLDRLDNIVRTIVNRLPYARGMPVRVIGIDPTQVPRLSKQQITRLEGVSAREANQARSESRDAVREKRVPFEGVNYWDIITDICRSCGYVPFVDIDVLKLAPPRTLFDNAGRAVQFGEDQPFEVIETDGIRNVRRMVYGENVAQLTFSREMGRITAPHIACVAYDPGARDPAKRFIKEVYPKIPRETKLTPGGMGTVELKTIGMPPGVVDPNHLAAVAEAVHELMGRNEMTATLTTRDLASFVQNRDAAVVKVNGSQDDPLVNADLIDLRAGDALEVLIQPSDLNPEARRFSDLQDVIRNPPEVTAARLQSQGWPQAAIQKLLRLLQHGLPTKFRVRNVRFRFTAQDGMTIEIEAVNFVEVRADALLADVGAAARPATTQSGPVTPSSSRDAERGP